MCKHQLNELTPAQRAEVTAEWEAYDAAIHHAKWAAVKSRRGGVAFEEAFDAAFVAEYDRWR